MIAHYTGKLCFARTCPTAAFFLAALLLLHSACSKDEPITSSSGHAPSAAHDKPSTSRVVFKSADGRELTLNDLKGAAEKVRPELMVPAGVPREAEELHQLARQAGSKNELDKALELLERAHKLAPGWAYPVYDIAFTHLLKGDVERAEAKYAEVDRMAPRGFFSSKTSLDCLRREREGKLQAGFCKEFVALETVNNAAQKRAILQGMVEKFPEFPPAWKEILPFLEGDESRLKAIGMGLAHSPDDDTKGALLIHKAAILYQRDPKEATQILGQLALDPQSTAATEQLAKATLASLLKEPSAGK